MNQQEKNTASLLLVRMAAILDVAEEVAEEIFTDVIENKDKKSAKTSAVITDLIKLIQLLEKQYNLLRTVEKEQQDTEDLPKPNEELIRNYLNKKHEKMSRAEKALQKGKHKHVSFE